MIGIHTKTDYSPARPATFARDTDVRFAQWQTLVPPPQTVVLLRGDRIQDGASGQRLHQSFLQNRFLSKPVEVLGEDERGLGLALPNN